MRQEYYNVPEHREKKRRAARAAHATPAGAATKSAYLRSAHGNVDVVLPNSCAGNHVRKFSVYEPKSAARAAQMADVRVVVQQVTDDFFSSSTRMCSLLRTVPVDPERGGPFQASTPPPHHPPVIPCVVTPLPPPFFQASINRIDNSCVHG